MIAEQCSQNCEGKPFYLTRIARFVSRLKKVVRRPCKNPRVDYSQDSIVDLRTFLEDPLEFHQAHMDQALSYAACSRRLSGWATSQDHNSDLASRDIPYTRQLDGVTFATPTHPPIGSVEQADQQLLTDEYPLCQQSPSPASETYSRTESPQNQQWIASIMAANSKWDIEQVDQDLFADFPGVWNDEVHDTSTHSSAGDLSMLEVVSPVALKAQMVSSIIGRDKQERPLAWEEFVYDQRTTDVDNEDVEHDKIKILISDDLQKEFQRRTKEDSEYVSERILEDFFD